MPRHALPGCLRAFGILMRHILPSAMAAAQRVRVAGHSAGRDEGAAQSAATRTRPPGASSSWM